MSKFVEAELHTYQLVTKSWTCLLLYIYSGFSSGEQTSTEIGGGTRTYM